MAQGQAKADKVLRPVPDGAHGPVRARGEVCSLDEGCAASPIGQTPDSMGLYRILLTSLVNGLAEALPPWGNGAGNRAPPGTSAEGTHHRGSACGGPGSSGPVPM